MSEDQIYLILKMILINLQLPEIFLVLDQVYNILKQQKQDMKKVLDIRDIDVRIKMAVIYNEFRSRFPDLFGIYTNYKGEEVYFMKFYYNVSERKYSRFKTESGFEDGEVSITKTVPKEIKINLYGKRKEKMKILKV
jgi:hypothetical protein